MEKRLQNFLIDDLKTLENDIVNLTTTISSFMDFYGRKSTNDTNEKIRKSVENVEMFLSYWKQHAQIKN